MLTIAQKAQILAKAGAGTACSRSKLSQAEWERQIEADYVAYSATRAARSLRDAEDARHAEMLRRMAWSSASL